MTDAIIQETIIDFTQDFEELQYLYESYVVKLNKFRKELNSAKSHIRSETLIFLVQETDKYLRWFNKSLKELNSIINACSNIKGISEIIQLSQTKEKYFDLLRNHIGVISNLITSSDWQSPSYLYSLFSNAGRQTGKIIGTINDYKRDQHLDGIDLERAYLKEYIDAPYKFAIKVYATASGMAAFSTILNYLLMEKKAQGKVLMGANVYFENKDLILKSYNDNLIVVDENNTSKVLDTINKHQPDILFFDSCSNTASVAVPDLAQITNYLIANYKKEVYLVIDNTCLSVFFQPMRLVVGKRSKVTLLTFESLNKYLQFGLDKTTGGIIAAYGKDVGKLYHYRDHLGTNITDVSSLIIPQPNRKFLQTRLIKHQRNACLLASNLQGIIDGRKTGINRIFYPGLIQHPGYQTANQIGFACSYFTLEFQKKNIPLYKKFINCVLNEAKKQKVNIVAGTSFGLNTTRIYLTSLRTEYGEPFVRVAVGTENRMQMELLKEVFRSVIKSN